MTTNQNNKNLVFWDNRLDKKYGKKGTAFSEKYEEELYNTRWTWRSIKVVGRLVKSKVLLLIELPEAN